MTPELAEILRTGHGRSVDGQTSIPLDSAITPPDVGLFLQDLIRQRKPTTTLEVGLAYGISGLFICEALRECGGKRHIAIDPNQSTQWEGIGFNNLAQAGFRDLLELHESPPIWLSRISKPVARGSSSPSSTAGILSTTL